MKTNFIKFCKVKEYYYNTPQNLVDLVHYVIKRAKLMKWTFLKWETIEILLIIPPPPFEQVGGIDLLPFKY